MGGEGTAPFVQLIEGGAEGQTYQDINDFFYYSMIRSKKENTTKTRKLEGHVPVDQRPSKLVKGAVGRRQLSHPPPGNGECQLSQALPTPGPVERIPAL